MYILYVTLYIVITIGGSLHGTILEGKLLDISLLVATHIMAAGVDTSGQ